MKTLLRAFLVASCALCAGCLTTPQRDATAVLIARPDFNDAARAAPKWVSAALHEITQLESELEKNRK
jgi:hypothetical protein